MNTASNPITKIAAPPPIFANSIEDTITADNAESFDEILKRQFSVRNESALQSPSGLYGIPSGLDIQELNKDYSEVEKLVKTINPTQNNDFQNLKDNENLKSIDSAISDMDLNKQGHDIHSQLFKLAKKHAANFYGKCAGNVVLNLDEFVNDTLKMES